MVGSIETWQDRLREAAYTPPSGGRITFSYEDVERAIPLRTVAFDFPGINESYIQQNGFRSRRYPLRCIFWGPQCDRQAQLFEDALCETGIGRLEHPIYGSFDVIPTGEISRRDDLKSAANQAIVQIEFSTTTGIVYPVIDATGANEITLAISAFDLASVNQFSSLANVSKASFRSSLKSGMRGALRQIGNALDGVSHAVGSINREFRNIQSTLNYGMDVLIGKPLLLAEQVRNLIRAPSRALSGIQSRLDGYAQLQQSIFGGSLGNPLESLSSGVGVVASRLPLVANQFHLNDLVTSNAVASSVDAASSEAFQTRKQAINAMSSIADQFDNWSTWRDFSFGALSAVDWSRVDSGDSYSALQHAVALACGYLVSSAIDLKLERTIILDRERTIVDLCAQLYGSVEDDKLDYLIDTNSLSGSDILELQRGRSIVYYK